ncbi:hypothetical protein V5P93_002230 [Actinokineospora auranticolor]|uniref:Tachylectin n=1 Tax=Actinokineospora auranticolor TaxID=155976 RepID=A0A2S6GEP9_9PSEU|nr:tectonin domain-containing protein [Actinokineospora auranticolor]PPK63680.1 hypothetical protein CLV40_12515 [Actinokineospora auranticolor]
MSRRLFVSAAVALAAALVLPTQGVATAAPEQKAPRSLSEIVSPRSPNTLPKHARTNTRARAAAAAVTENTLYALSPNRDAVLMYDGTSWTQIGGAAAQIYAGGGQVFATNPTTGSIFYYEHETTTWHLIGGPGDQFVVDDAGILTGRSAGGVFEWWGTEWRKIGGPARSLIAGGEGLLAATNTTNGDVYIYTAEPANPWQKIGGAGQDFVITAPGYIFGQSTGGIFTWTGTSWDWIQVGGPAGKMYGGPYLVATAPSNGNAFRFLEDQFRWESVGGAGDQFAAANDGTLYRLNSTGVYRLSSSGDGSWARVGDPASTLAV